MRLEINDAIKDIGLLVRVEHYNNEINKIADEIVKLILLTDSKTIFYPFLASVSLGRNTSCDIVIEDDRRISSVHTIIDIECKLDLKRGDLANRQYDSYIPKDTILSLSCMVNDLSRNGTYNNGILIKEQPSNYINVPVKIVDKGNQACSSLGLTLKNYSHAHESAFAKLDLGLLPNNTAVCSVYLSLLLVPYNVSILDLKLLLASLLTSNKGNFAIEKPVKQPASIQNVDDFYKKHNCNESDDNTGRSASAEYNDSCNFDQKLLNMLDTVAKLKVDDSIKASLMNSIIQTVVKTDVTDSQVFTQTNDRHSGKGTQPNNNNSSTNTSDSQLTNCHDKNRTSLSNRFIQSVLTKSEPYSCKPKYAQSCRPFNDVHKKKDFYF